MVDGLKRKKRVSDAADWPGQKYPTTSAELDGRISMRANYSTSVDFFFVLLFKIT